MNFRKISIGNNASVNSDIIVVDRYTGVLVFVSAVGYVTAIKDMGKSINYNNSVYIPNGGSYKTIAFGYNVETRKTTDSDFTHLVASRKDSIIQDAQHEERLVSYVYARNPEELCDMVYDKLYKYMSVPLLREWMPVLTTNMQSLGYIRELNVLHGYDYAPFSAYALNLTKTNLIELVTGALKNQRITINESNEVSDTMQRIDGLDSYLNTFGETLASRIQESFVPKFTPGQDDYSQSVHDFDDACYHAGIEIFEAQKAVVQASINNLKESDVTFVIGEMGSGKTAIGAGITYAHGKQLGYTSIVMCPSHLVNKWKREVERLIPNAKGYIVRQLSDLLALEPLVKNKAKKENSYIIMSKESAKFGYDMCPAVLWSPSKNAFVCPVCGQTLTKKHYEGTGRRRREVRTAFSKNDMSKQYAYNLTCDNTVRVWNKENFTWEEKTCDNKLWRPLNKEEIATSDWIKLGKEGWIMKHHVVELYNELLHKQDLTRKETQLLLRLEEQVQEFESNQEFNASTRAPRKYPLAQYIKKYWKGHIDYFIADEVHTYKGESEQGYAFADLAASAKKVLCLTGTLLNGYADGLFYILYRVVPYLMKKEGFNYRDEAEFMRAYGVVKKTTRHTVENGREGERIGNGSEKRLPGVSPLVFTNFLLENAVFLSLSDMSEGLPEYTEIPVGVTMDEDLRAAYTSLEEDLRSHVGGYDGKGMKIMGQMVQALSVYPDMPYDQPPIIHPDTNETLVVPTELNRGLRNKEERLLEIVQSKIENNEKVLIYYQWTNRTDTAKKLKNAISDLGISVAVLESRVSADQREEWIEAQLENGVQVVLCNPTLVETGLDLMDFTTIIFYQVGYNIFTMRQASRRSWRLGQTHPIQVYFMYYRDTIQEQALSLMATKLQASMAIEGKFSEEGLRAMSNNEDLLTQIANSVVNGIKETINAGAFQSVKHNTEYRARRSMRVRKTRDQLVYKKPVVSRLAYFKPKVNKQEALTSTQQLIMSLYKNQTHIGNLF